jgi:hypothetical protein
MKQFTLTYYTHRKQNEALRMELPNISATSKSEKVDIALSTDNYIHDKEQTKYI